VSRFLIHINSTLKFVSISGFGDKVDLIFMKQLEFILIALFLTNSLYAFSAKISNITVKDGLPSTIVRDVLQDNFGFLWIATKHGLVKYDGYEVEIINDYDDKSLGDIWSLVLNDDNHIIIASKTRGLFKYKHGIIEQINILQNLKNLEITSIEVDSNGALWIGTNQGTYHYFEEKLIEVRSFKNEISYGFLKFDEKKILSLTNKSIIKYNVDSKSSKKVYGPKNDKLNKVIHKDLKGNIWLGREDGLYIFNNECLCFENSFKELEDKVVYSLESNQEYLWIGTIYDDLFIYEYKTSKLNKISKNLNKFGLTDKKSILSLYYDNTGTMWVGTFHNGLFSINSNHLDFKSRNSKSDKFFCSNNFTVHDILKTNDGSLLLATENGLVRIDRDGNCSSFNHEEDNENSLSANLLLSLQQSSNGDVWITNNEIGIDKLSTDTWSIERKAKKANNLDFYFSVEVEPGKLILGSFKKGLYTYDIAKDSIEKINTIDSKYDSSSFYMYSVNKNGQYYFGTDNGVAFLNQKNTLEQVTIDHNNEFLEITALNFDKKGALWIGVNNKYLLKYTTDGVIQNITNHLVKSNNPIKVFSIIPTDIDTLWFSSNKGIHKLNTNTYENWEFNAQDGLQGNGFLGQSYHHEENGNIYFGGKDGINYFNPHQVSLSTSSPQTAITKFKYFNKVLDVGVKTDSNFILDKPINYLDEIELGYQDYIIGFEFAALDYADSMRNKYAYRLKGLNNNWVYVDANDRKVSYTNLKPGNYTFQVKASNKDGMWNHTPKELKIKVNPAPWFSPWAYFSYLFILVLIIWWYVSYKTLASRKRARELEKEVKERTHDANLQRKIVESLLKHKNEVFANITHELKTPLSLIIGPIDQLRQEVILVENKDILNMVQRNAKRLLLMVGQILKLSQAEVDKGAIRESQNIKPILTMLYESFSPLADDKNLNLILINEHDANIYTTSECLEIIIGNLLSNALKYTNSGGEISLVSKLIDDNILISVKDNGMGIDKKDLGSIFKRFVRLDQHKSISGTGIGLSVVKEIVETNNGQVKVISEWGKGSEFIITFPISDIDSNNELSQVMVKQLVSNTKNEINCNYSKIISRRKRAKNKIIVLIIEDNLDMQAHIGNVLKEHFYCLFADRGRKGIALALKEVPDVVICDVMMPTMDGYQVTRVLRHDGRTSHIPIIMLTALNTRESRIKGWRENIDTYITKPFDSTELNAQIKNILTIRKLLQNQTNKAIKNNIPLSSIDLPKQDQKFIEKFRDVIAKHYVNEYFQVADIASKMAVSERQLQRKIKALINESPMDMLREYRLEKSAMKLKDGYQVGIVSDAVGFSSVSYYSRCFKKKYGMTPKRYQTLNKR